MTTRIGEGGCMCGAVRYRLEGEPEGGTICHCESCRRSSGAPSLAWVIFPAGGFRFTAGEPRHYRSSPHIQRSFCGNCGTQVLYRSERRPEVVDIPTATLDAPNDYPPDREIWTGEKIEWETLNGKLPIYPRSSKG